MDSNCNCNCNGKGAVPEATVQNMGRRAEEALSKDGERLHLIVRATSDLPWDFDYTSSTIWWSPGYYEKVGLPDGEPMTREHWLSMMHPHDALRVKATVRELESSARSERWAVDYRLRLPDGTYADMHDRGYFVRDEDGGLLRAVGAAADVTKSKRTEDELRKRDEQLQSIIDNTPSAINVKDLEGRYLLVNHWYEVYNGVPASQLIGKTSYDIFPDYVAREHQEHSRIVVQTNQPVTFEEEVPFADGTHTHLTTEFPLYSADGKPYAVCSIVTDITERKKDERQLREHAQDQTRLLYELQDAHEAEQRRLATDIHDGPLQSLGVSLLALDRLARRYERGDGAAVKTELTVLRSTIEETVSEVRAVLEDLSLEVLTSYGLSVALAGQMERFALATGIRVDLRNSLPMESRLPADLELLVYRLAQEGLTNVRKHAQASGVTVCLEACEDGDGSVGVVSCGQLGYGPGGYVQLTIQDDGRGFDVEAFESGGARGGALGGGSGSGLGLRSMRQRLEAAGGRMVVSSMPGQGTLLSFCCPVALRQPTLSRLSGELVGVS